MAAGNRIRLDLNSPAFEDVFFRLQVDELKQVVAPLARLRDFSVRVSQRIRAVAFRDGDFLRLISLHPDHDSAYKP
ncbi:MAG: hypothetical protein GEV06_24950 [Luteitalea sp.]|nr:hypothetical protein [Luteitalea sp.]